MNKAILLSVSLLAALPLALQAQDTSNPATSGGWSGSGEFGFASAHGNSHTENLNAKLGLNQENERWKNAFSLTGLRSKADTTNDDGSTDFETTANRYEAAASVGYKFNPRSYLVNAARYEHDEFGSNLWQATYSIGYGYIALKNARAELSFEVGPGYKRYQPARIIETTDDGTIVHVTPDVKNEAIARSLINGKLHMTANTSLEDTLLIESGTENTYLQNDLGLSVSVTQKLALKLAYQVRYNSDVDDQTRHTDTLYTTNLVYNF